ncbi:MAG: YihY/virulence factor BrkB family protein [Bacteroidetes bacterium]|nr:YihY/virulence factor BrkB family protein [Bacteroidota bacterium]MDA1344665.1 YihY/virulence factor BrkB family protein [Bacteroidota bacterium]
MKKRVRDIPVLKKLIQLLDAISVPGFEGFSLYRLMELYIIGIVRGTLTSRAGSISFSFFMALFPFLLFVLNLIPFVPIENFDVVLLNFIELLLPKETQGFFSDIFLDIQSKPRGGLLSSVFLLSIFLTANGVSAIFASFEESYHIKISRTLFKQYLYAMGVGVLLALSLLLAVAVFVFFELYILRNLQGILENTVNWIRIGQFLFFILLTYLSVAILYYFGTIETRKMRFFSPGALMTTLLIILTTYLFGLYIENFSTYNQLYGSIGALLIFLLYIWINSNILLLGFELNATITSIKNSSPF